MYISLCDLDIPTKKIAKLFGNSRDPDQTQQSVVSDQGLHCLPVNLFEVSSLNSELSQIWAE